MQSIITFIHRIKVQTNRLVLTKKTIFLILTFIIFLAGVLRWYHIGAQSLWFDELVSAAQAKMDLPNLLSSLKADFHPPVYFVLLHYWVKIFGMSEIGLRSMSFVFGCLTIPMAYIVGKELFNPLTGLLSALLISLSRFHIYFSQETRSYSLTGFLTLISFYFFIMIIKRGTQKRYLAGLIVANGLLLYTHSTTIFILLTQNVIWLILKFFYKNTIKYPQWALYQILSFIPFTPWLFIEINQFNDFQGSNVLAVPNIYGLLNTFYQYSGSFFLLFIFALTFILGSYSRERGNAVPRLFASSTRTAFLSIWVGIPILAPFILSQFVSPIYTARNTLSAAFGFYILIAKSLTAIRNIIITSVLFFVILLASAQNLTNYYSVPDKEQWREAVAYVDDSAHPGDMVSIDASAYDYYNTRKDLIRVENLSEPAGQSGLSSKPQLWIIQPPGVVPGTLQTARGTFAFNQKKDFFRVSVSLYTPSQ
jgi:mannosyltransferase